MYFSKITYSGSYLPEKIIDNKQLSLFVDTSDEWIRSRSGIGTRHFTENENTSDLAINAAKKIIQNGNIDVCSIDLIIVATVTGDYITPSTACLVQAGIGAKNAFCFDINAACSGFMYGLSVADKFIKSGSCKNALVIGAEVLSKFTSPDDRGTFVLFGDGAAGVFLEKDLSTGILAENIGSDGTKGLSLTGGKSMPANVFNNIEKCHDVFLHMDGRAIFDFATRQTPKSIKSILDKSDTSLDDIKYIVPHQANLRIVEIIARKLKIPMDKFFLNIEKTGNTSGASIPIALDELISSGLVGKGDKIILTGFGGGLTWGSMLVEF